MEEDISRALIQTIANTKKDLFVLFKGDKPVVTNSAFNNFFGVTSLDAYTRNYGDLLNSFVPHPQYFYNEKIADGESWFDAILKLDEIDRIVSMLSQNYNPSAFSVAIDRTIEDYNIVTFTDITQDLIKRIMIENNANIDKKSGAYDKDYFLHVSKSFEDAAAFNEKILGAVVLSIDKNKNPDFVDDERALKSFTSNIKNIIRQDDMLVYWGGGKFLLMFLVDNQENAHQMLNKLLNLVDSNSMKEFGCKLDLAFQNENKSINSLLKMIM